MKNSKLGTIVDFAGCGALLGGGFLALLFCLGGCTEKEFDPNNPAKSYEIAKEPYDEESYEIAITKLSEFKSRFPYSKFAIEAELLVANSHFELEHFPEAAVAYEQFVKLHPKHPKTDFAMFRIGESYWSEAPEEIDREQEYTKRAIDEWGKLVSRMPDSQYAQKASKLVEEGRRRVASSVEFIAEFYCKQEIYDACAYRYIKLAEDFPQFENLKKRAYQEAAMAIEIIAEEKKADAKKDSNLFFKNYTYAGLLDLAKSLRAKS